MSDEKLWKAISGNYMPEIYKQIVGSVVFSPPPVPCEDKLKRCLVLLDYIRHNWDKPDFDGEAVDKRIDELLGAS